MAVEYVSPSVAASGDDALASERRANRRRRGSVRREPVCHREALRRTDEARKNGTTPEVLRRLVDLRLHILSAEQGE